TFAELDAQVTRLARLLLARGAGPERLVAVAVERSTGLVVAVLAVAMTGAAYLPLDPGQPAGRLQIMLGHAAPALVLVTSATAGQLPATEVPVLLLDAPETVAARAAADPAPIDDADRTGPLRPEHPAYVIYTSGSTGRPKGVVVPHAALNAYLAW